MTNLSTWVAFDCRSCEAIDFAGAHLTGAINVGIDGKYATWAGTVLTKDTPIIVIADEDLIAIVHRITAPTVDALYATPTILDVRSEKEYGGGHIVGSVNIPLNQLQDRIKKVSKRGPLVVHCQGGYRSSIACSLLQRHGLNDVRDLVGGYKAWVQSKLPIIEPVET